jgi:alanyl-tRNA synthetase
MTERLYYSDSYLADFQAAVVGRDDQGRRIYLDRTAFYPTSGGQPFDTGWLGGQAVVDVVDEGERVAHLLAAPLHADRAAGRIDWVRRFDHMQQHTGQHLLSAVFEDLLGYPTVSVHFGNQSSTLDLEASALMPEQILAVEERGNAVVAENRAVRVSNEDARVAAGLRKPSGREGIIRVVSIQDLDRSACGGTHVSSTGEIGAIFIRKVERIRRNLRVEFLCGQRAIRRARADYEGLTRIATALSAGGDEVAPVIDARLRELRDTQARLREAEAALSLHRAKELYERTAAAGGVRRIVERRTQGALGELRGLGQAVAAMPGGVFIGAIEQPPAILVAAAADSGIDAGGSLKQALSAVAGRGGGSARLAQGTVPSLEALDRVLASLLA